MFAKLARYKIPAVTLSLAWLAIIVTGIYILGAYANAPGRAGSPPAHWPEASQLQHNPDRPTLIMFVHPHCPCSRASIGELALLMAHCQGRVDTHLFFLQPEGMASDWTLTDTWKEASQIPGVTVHRDKGGREAALFRAETSGDTGLYDRQGALKFHGGITIARGHSGDNPGRDSLQALILGLPTQLTHTPAFGCSLFECRSEAKR